MDFFVPTATFRVLFVLVILSHDRRRIVHLNVTDHPTAAWTRQQIREAFPDQTAPAYLLRDRDGCYGPDFGRLVESFGTEEVVTAPRSPWQNGRHERMHLTLKKEATKPAAANVLQQQAALMTFKMAPQVWTRTNNPPVHCRIQRTLPHNAALCCDEPERADAR